jgi:hypothetical protein
MSGSDIPDDVKAQAMDAVGDLAGSFPAEAQLEEPPAPPEVIAPEVPMEDFDSYAADVLARYQAGEPPPGDPPVGPFPVADADPGELQQPMPTPGMDGLEPPAADFDSYAAQVYEQFEAGEPPPSEAPAGPYLVEDVDAGELQQPLNTPQVDADIEP